jgi:putative hydrolase of HD superfamily
MIAFFVRMAMCSFMLTDPRINRDRLIKVCMMHDVAEATVGDITPQDKVSKEEKRRLEEVRHC